MSDISDAVQNGVNAYAEAEAALQVAHDALLKLPAFYSAAANANPTPPAGVKPLGYLEAQRRAGRAKKIAGLVGAVIEDVMAAHGDDTARCQELDIDIPPPPAPPGTVTPFSGSR